MSQINQEYSSLEVSVTTCYGIKPLSGVEVTVRYDGLPYESKPQVITHFTDENGRTAPFCIKMRRVKLGERSVDLPRNSGCHVTVKADGYVICKVRNIPIFSGITVKRSFDLLPMNIKNEA